MYPAAARDEARRLLHEGLSLSEVSRRLGVARSTVREWRSREARPRDCPRCAATRFPAPERYAALLGYYLGDGCVSSVRTTYVLRVSCDRVYPRIVDDVATSMAACQPAGRVFRVPAPGVVVVQAMWKHWACLFPQHGPGRKHQRRIELQPWQEEVVAAHPGDFLRGLFHSDGARVRNWATRPVAGGMRRYEYPRWQLTNHSDDILRLAEGALDRAGVAWRRSSWRAVSVSRGEAVQRLDELIGPKA